MQKQSRRTFLRSLKQALEFRNIPEIAQREFVVFSLHHLWGLQSLAKLRSKCLEDVRELLQALPAAEAEISSLRLNFQGFCFFRCFVSQSWHNGFKGVSRGSDMAGWVLKGVWKGLSSVLMRVSRVRSKGSTEYPRASKTP